MWLYRCKVHLQSKSFGKGDINNEFCPFILQSSALLCPSHNSFHLYDALAIFSMYTNWLKSLLTIMIAVTLQNYKWGVPILQRITHKGFSCGDIVPFWGSKANNLIIFKKYLLLPSSFWVILKHPDMDVGCWGALMFLFCTSSLSMILESLQLFSRTNIIRCFCLYHCLFYTLPMWLVENSVLQEWQCGY